MITCPKCQRDRVEIVRDPDGAVRCRACNAEVGVRILPQPDAEPVLHSDEPTGFERRPEVRQ